MRLIPAGMVTETRLLQFSNVEEDGGIVLYVGTYDMFTFTYDGEYLILSVGAKLYFEKVS